MDNTKTPRLDDGTRSLKKPDSTDHESSQDSSEDYVPKHTQEKRKTSSSWKRKKARHANSDSEDLEDDDD